MPASWSDVPLALLQPFAQYYLRKDRSKNYEPVSDPTTNQLLLKGGWAWLTDKYDIGFPLELEYVGLWQHTGCLCSAFRAATFWYLSTLISMSDIDTLHLYQHLIFSIQPKGVWGRVLSIWNVYRFDFNDHISQEYLKSFVLLTTNQVTLFVKTLVYQSFCLFIPYTRTKPHMLSVTYACREGKNIHVVLSLSGMT